MIPSTWLQFQSMLQRRAAGEPMAYILGVQGFYDLDLMVTPSVLVPRPETELLLEEALRLTQDSPGARVADIGTGSGALAVTFARHRPQCRRSSPRDISAEALEVARQNARSAGLRESGSSAATWRSRSLSAASKSIC